MLKPVIVAIAISALLPLPAASQAQNNQGFGGPGSKTEEDSWMEMPFSGDDRPYTRSRLDIENAFEQGAEPNKLVQKYRNLARQNPNDLKAQFRWAYASYQAVKAKTILSHDLSSAIRKLQSFKPPYTYECARLRFILEARVSPRQKLKLLGERLLRKNPNDFDVKYNLIKVIEPTASSWDKQKAVLYCQQLIKSFPKKNSPYAMLGFVYFRSWLKAKNKADAQEAISAYREYVRRVPANDSFRKQAQSIIATIQKG